MYRLWIPLPVPSRLLHQEPGNQETSRLPLKKLPHMPGSQTPRDPAMTHHYVMPSVAFRLTNDVSIPERGFRRSTSGLCVPLPTLRTQPHDYIRMTRGQC